MKPSTKQGCAGRSMSSFTSSFATAAHSSTSTTASERTDDDSENWRKRSLLLWNRIKEAVIQYNFDVRSETRDRLTVGVAGAAITTWRYGRRPATGESRHVYYYLIMQGRPAAGHQARSQEKILSGGRGRGMVK